MQTSKTCFAAILRHGERADWAGVPYPNDVDPPLTDEGMVQAAKAGENLKACFEKYKLKFDKIVIETSPFIRTMMTASQIARELGVSTITINFQASEVLTEYDCDPMDKIEFAVCGHSFQKMKDELRERYNQRFWEDGIDFEMPAAGSAGDLRPQFGNWRDEGK